MFNTHFSFSLLVSRLFSIKGRAPLSRADSALKLYLASFAKSMQCDRFSERSNGGPLMADLLVEKTNHIGILKLNRPDRMNAISVEMLNDLGEALKDFDSDPEDSRDHTDWRGTRLLQRARSQGHCRRTRNRSRTGGAGRVACQHARAADRDAESNRLARHLRDQRRGGRLRIRSRTRMRPAADQRSRQAGAGIRQARNRARERRHLVSAAAGGMGAGVRNRIHRRRHRARRARSSWDSRTKSCRTKN